LHPELVRRGLGEIDDDGEVVWGILIFDGVATHLSHDLITWCADNHLELILRPPNTTSVCQPEDVILFKQFKETWHACKDKILMLRITDTSNTDLNPCKLTWEDMHMGIRAAHEASFTPYLIGRAWKAVGIKPFTRRVEHNLEQKEVAAARRRALNPIHTMSLNDAIACILAPDPQQLPEAVDAGRNVEGRVLAHERPLTAPEAIAARQVHVKSTAHAKPSAAARERRR
jgi:hypothetical protein